MAIKINRVGVSGGLAACLLAVGIGVLPAAQASILTMRPASSVCKAAFGAGADLFYFDAEYAQNIGTGINYLSCSLSDVVDTYSDNITSVNLHFQNPNGSAAAVTCVTVLAHPGSSRVFASTNISVTANTGTAHYNANLDLTGLTRTAGGDEMYTMSCAIPAQVKFNSIDTTSPGNLAA